MNRIKTLANNLMLPLTVFITGACVLIIEIVAVRVLSPHYGNTIFTVSSVISVILAALSLGYYYGGKLADKKPSEQIFYKIILVSGVLVLGFYLASFFVLPILDVYFTIILAPLIASMLLFFVPAAVLGTLSPFAVKLQSLRTPEQGLGSISGKIFFFSTLGSIAGSLLSGFYLIPNFGLDRIFVTTGIVLVALGFFPLLTKKVKKKLFFDVAIYTFLITLAISYLSNAMRYNTVYLKDGVYEKIRIVDGTYNNRPTRFFIQDRSRSGAMYLDTKNPSDMVYGYTKYYQLYKLSDVNIKNVLVIGGGAYSIPKAFATELPNANVVVSEIEPNLHDLARKYFFLENEKNIVNTTEDGRRHLRNTTTKYDIIFSDVYYSLFSIPTHFTTQEFFLTVKDRLSENGLFFANLVGNLSSSDNGLLLSEIKTIRSVFPNSYFFAVESLQKETSQNIIAVAFNSNKMVEFDPQENIPDELKKLNLNEKLINVELLNMDDQTILKDNYAPIDWLTAKLLKSEVTNSTR